MARSDPSPSYVADYLDASGARVTRGFDDFDAAWVFIEGLPLAADGGVIRNPATPLTPDEIEGWVADMQATHGIGGSISRARGLVA